MKYIIKFLQSRDNNKRKKFGFHNFAEHLQKARYRPLPWTIAIYLCRIIIYNIRKEYYTFFINIPLYKRRRKETHRWKKKISRRGEGEGEILSAAGSISFQIALKSIGQSLGYSSGRILGCFVAVRLENWSCQVGALNSWVISTRNRKRPERRGRGVGGMGCRDRVVVVARWKRVVCTAGSLDSIGLMKFGRGRSLTVRRRFARLINALVNIF